MGASDRRMTRVVEIIDRQPEWGVCVVRKYVCHRGLDGIFECESVSI